MAHTNFILLGYFFLICSIVPCFCFQAACGIYDGSGPVCPFDATCHCSSPNNDTELYCGTTLTAFPIFTYGDSSPITFVFVEGYSYTVIYDNSFFLLMNLMDATICIINYEVAYYGPGSETLQLTTYNNTFLTYNQGGITSLYFYGYNPLNISTISNSRDIELLSIEGGLMTAAPNLQTFTTLKSVDLSSNSIAMLQPNDFNLSSLTSVDISYNLLTNLNSDAFTFYGSLITLNAQNNRITTVDSGFSKWLSLSASNILNLNNNPPFQCDSNLQWMASYVICPPQQIQVLTTATCQTGEPLINFLIPFAKCTH